MIFIFLFNDTATTEIYTLSLHDALPISARRPARWRRSSGARSAGGTRSAPWARPRSRGPRRRRRSPARWTGRPARSEEHTSELQSRQYLVCRLLLEKKKRLTELEGVGNL